MYAAQKYSAQNRLETSREFARQYPDRVPTILSSPHWAFYTFKCCLLPKDMSIREFAEIAFANWKHKFPSGISSILLKVASGSHLNKQSILLKDDDTFDSVATSWLSPDGFLYLTAHTLT